MGANSVNSPFHRVLGKSSNPGAAGIPRDAAPSLDFLGCGIQDHRLPYNSRGSSPNQPGVVGWYGAGCMMVANYVPSALATANIAAAQVVANGIPLTLAAGTGITQLTAVAPAMFQPTGLVQASGLCIDALPAVKSFGGSGDLTTSFYDRGAYVGRGVSITAAAGAVGGSVLVQGLDVYGYPLSQTVVAAAGATVNTKKTFKVVTSVTPAFTDASHNYSVGTADIYGFGLLASFWGDVDVVWNNATITANTGFVAADVTSPATAATGDVRGTYAVQSASDGAKRLALFITPSLGAIAANATTGLFGAGQA